MNITILKKVRENYIVIYTPIGESLVTPRGQQRRENDNWSILTKDGKKIYQDYMDWYYIHICLIYNFVSQERMKERIQKRKKCRERKEEIESYEFMLKNLKSKVYVAY